MSQSRRRNSPKEDPWKTLVYGSKGRGKSYTSLKEIAAQYAYGYNVLTNNPHLRQQNTKESQPEIAAWRLNSITDNSSALPVQSSTDGNTGQWWNDVRYPQQTNEQQPRQFIWTGTGSAGAYPYGGNTYQPIPITTPQQNPVSAPKHTTEELKGKLIAYATITIDGVEHKGVLFVRKCGAWKLIECETMKKIASGSENDPMPEVAIHYVIYSQFDSKKKKNGRFEDIDMKEHENISDGAKK